MKMKKMVSIIVFLLTLVLSGPVFAQETLPPDGTYFHPIMRPDPVTLQKWIDEYETAPTAEIDPVIHSYLVEAQAAGNPTSLSLLGHLKYTPSERNQGGCGDCWVWASTGVMEIALSVQNNVLDRLSTQFLNSCYTNACCGGSLYGFSSWYASEGYAIPWSNTNANFQDASRSCGSSSLDSCANISTNPNYPITSISVTTIQTTGYPDDTTPIANIMNVLNQGKGIYFAYFLANSTDWNGFYSFWGNQPETYIWDPDVYCGHTLDPNTYAGHAVLIVGYDDSSADSTQHYWIVLNSWGTTGSRPNGLFRMKMHMNYNCTMPGLGGSPRQFQTLNMTYNVPVAYHPDTIGVYRPSNQKFYLRNSNTTGVANVAAQFGMPGDIPIVGDWDGNGTTTIGVYRPSNQKFYLRNSNTTGVADVVAHLTTAIAGDIPIVGDWTGKGYDSIGVYRPSNGTFYLRNSNTTGVADIAFSFGPPGGIPIAGDWNGNGIDTVGIYLNGIFYLKNSNTGGSADLTFSYGMPGDVPIAGDWDGLP